MPKVALTGQGRSQNVRLSVSLSRRSHDALKVLALARGRPISVVLRELLDDAAEGIAEAGKLLGLAQFGTMHGADPVMSDAEARKRLRELLAEVFEVASYTVDRGSGGGGGRSPATPHNAQGAP